MNRSARTTSAGYVGEVCQNNQADTGLGHGKKQRGVAKESRASIGEREHQPKVAR